MSEQQSQDSSFLISPLEISEAKKRLFAHKSLWDLWRASWHTGVDWPQLALSASVGLCVFLTALLKPVTAVEAASYARMLANDGLTFATTLLGFLIAGFTVFATITKPEIFALMARWPEDDGLTHLQKVFLLFMQVFAHYCAFCLTCVLIKLTAGPNGPIVSLLSDSYAELRLIYASLVWALLSGWLVYLLVLLPIFIFNIYSMQLVVIDFTMQEEEERIRSAKRHQQGAEK